MSGVADLAHVLQVCRPTR